MVCHSIFWGYNVICRIWFGHKYHCRFLSISNFPGIHGSGRVEVVKQYDDEKHTFKNCKACEKSSIGLIVLIMYISGIPVIKPACFADFCQPDGEAQ
jgi:hypothetical protein